MTVQNEIFSSSFFSTNSDESSYFADHELSLIKNDNKLANGLLDQSAKNIILGKYQEKRLFTDICFDRFFLIKFISNESLFRRVLFFIKSPIQKTN